MKYKILDINLSKERVSQAYHLKGNTIKVINATSDCYIQFEELSNDPINLAMVDKIKLNFNKFYLSNVGMSGKYIKILVSENFDINDNIGVTNYTPDPIPPTEPTPPPTEPTPPTEPAKIIPDTAQLINIINPEPNVQLEVNLNTLNFTPYSDNGNNIRIVDFNHNPISFYLNDFNKVANTGSLFFKTPNKVINGVIIYPDELTTPSISDPYTVFEFYDNFESPNIDTTKWDIVNNTGWSIVNNKLRGTNTTGKLMSHALFTGGVILEIKLRSVTGATNGNTIGGFWKKKNDNFVLVEDDLNNEFIVNNGVWSGISDNFPKNIDILLEFITTTTSIKLKITRLDTGVTTYNETHTNSVVNEPIWLSGRPDNTHLNQTYDCFWDWIRVRKNTPATATLL